MPNNGKNLDELVSWVEKLRSKQFLVGTGYRTFLENGLPKGEFDVEVSGKIGHQDYRWLLECRDRPSQGQCRLLGSSNSQVVVIASGSPA